MSKTLETLESVVVRLVGDSGDGMQITGMQLSETTALAGNDLASFPDFPAEIRAPAGTIAGVSGFQLRFASSDIYTPGDSVDVLVAMNPAALKLNVLDLRHDGLLIVNTAAFDQKGLDKAGFKSNPLEDGSLNRFRVFKVDITSQTLRAVEELGITHAAAERCKNFYSLGLIYWLFSRDMSHTIAWIQAKFAKKDPLIAEANVRALKAGHAFGETAEMFTHSYAIPPAKLEPGVYTQVSGNEATVFGLLAAVEKSGLELFLGSYPITPASDILHLLAAQKSFGVRTLQAEDEIAAIGSTIGAAYAGAIAITTTSGPGFALKSEGMSLAVMLELPLIIFDIQRGGPSTGLPTKTEQADLLQAIFGRHGQAPIPVIAAATPGDCFWTALEAVRIAFKHVTPVIVLTDGYLANGAEPFRVPDFGTIPPIEIKYRTDPEGFLPYERNDLLARPLVLPGTPGLEHRIGGLEKQAGTGNVNYEAENHEAMVETREAKVANVALSYPKTEAYGDQDGPVCVVSWGSTYGAVRSAVMTMRGRGHRVGHVHLRYLNPLPIDLEPILRNYERVIVPEMNLGQLCMLLRAKYLIDARAVTKVQGKPFMESEIATAIASALES